jgi:hypothetical protein
MNRSSVAVLALAFFLFNAVVKLSAQGTAFSYQGRLNDSGAPANAAYDLRFALYDAVTNGNSLNGPLTNSAVFVTNGLFTVTLDFGAGVFTGPNRWLSIGVRTNGDTNAFTVLWPRQPVLPVPYAIFANSASNLTGTLAATQLTGTVPATLISGSFPGVVAFTNGGNSYAGTFAGNFSGGFAGNGASLTNLNGSNIVSGTVADARLTANVALLNANQTFTGVNNFTNWANYFTGNFFGNGLVGWVTVAGTSQQAQRDHGYMLTSSSLTTVTLPPNNGLTNGDIVRVSGAGGGGWQVAVNSGQSIIGNLASYRNFPALSSGSPYDWRRVCCSTDGSRMYAGGVLSGGVFVSTDSGRTWNSTSITGSGWFAVACSANGNIVYAAPNGGSGSIQISSDGGTTWNNIPNSAGSWMAVACAADGSKLFVAPQSGSLVEWSNGSWSTVLSGSYSWAAVACSSDGSRCIAATTGGSIYSSSSGWVSSGLGTLSALVASTDGQKLAAAVYGGHIITSSNGGSSWQTANTQTANWSCLAGSSDCSKLVAGVNNGFLYASANFGATWTALINTNQSWSGACMSADGNKFAVTAASGGVTGGIYYDSVSPQFISSTTNSIGGSQGSAVELQYIGNGQFMPVSSTGVIWAN